MKKPFVMLNALLIIIGLMIGGVSCKKDSTPVTFSMSSLKTTITGGDIDMNGQTAPTNIPTNPTIVAGFTVNLSAASVTASTVTLTNTLDNSTVELTLTPSTSSLTIVPNVPLGTGTPYTLKLNGIKSTDGQTITNLTRSFSTVGPYAPGGAIAYWSFDGNANDQIGTFNPKTNGIVAITYENSFNAAAGQCAKFNGTTSIIEIANGDLLSNSADVSLCFWVKTNSAGHNDAGGLPKGHFVMGLGAFYGFQFEIPADYKWCKLAGQYELADGTTAGEDLWFPGDGKTGANGGWQGWTFCKDLTNSGGVEGLIKDKWAFVVCTFDGPTKVATMYINGEKMKAFDFNLWPAGDVKTGVKGMKYGGKEPDVLNELAFGFVQSRGGSMWASEAWGGYQFPTANHFGGWLDEVRVYHRTLSEVEIAAMYKP
jgi:hypothetical protein